MNPFPMSIPIPREGFCDTGNMFRPHESMMKRFQLESPRPKNANGERHGHSWCVKSLGVIFVLVSSLLGQGGETSKVPVTAVEGESWLNHLHRTFDETSMGKTGRLGPPATTPGEVPAHWQLGLLSKTSDSKLPTSWATSHRTSSFRHGNSRKCAAFGAAPSTGSCTPC